MPGEEAAEQTKMEERRREIWTLPNLLTLLRVLLIPVFLWLMILGQTRGAFAVFLLAGMTDFLDGMAARLWRQSSKIGLWLDPAADKLLLTAAYVILGMPGIAQPNVIPFWVLFIVIGRDVLIVLSALVLIKWTGQREFYPTLIGKTTTVCQVLTVLAVLLFNAIPLKTEVLSWFYLLTSSATVLSGIDYAIKGCQMISRKNKREA